MSIREFFNAILDIDLLWIFGIVFSVSLILLIWFISQLKKVQLEGERTLMRIDDIFKTKKKNDINNESNKNKD